MAIADCGLDATALADQLARYRRLGAGASVIRGSALELTVDFASRPDPQLLHTTVAVERECCSFFALEYSETQQRLTVSVSDPARTGALDAIQAALTASAQGDATEPSRPQTGQASWGPSGRPPQVGQSSTRSSTPSSSPTRHTSRRSSSTSIHTPAAAGKTT